MVKVVVVGVAVAAAVLVVEWDLQIQNLRIGFDLVQHIKNNGAREIGVLGITVWPNVTERPVWLTMNDYTSEMRSKTKQRFIGGGLACPTR